MTVLVANYAEGGTNGVTVTTGNSGGGSGTALSAVTGSWTFSTLQAFEGTKSYRSSQAGVAQALQLSLPTSRTFAVYSAAQYLTAFPGSSFIVFKGLTGAFGAAWRIDLSAAGLIRIRNATNTQVAESVAAVTVGGWWRFKVTVTNSTTVGAITVEAYPGTSEVASITLSSSALNTAAETSHVQVGNSLSSPNLPDAYYDAIVVDDTAIDPVTITPASVGVIAGSTNTDIPATPVIVDPSAGGGIAGPTPGLLDGTTDVGRSGSIAGATRNQLNGVTDVGRAGAIAGRTSQAIDGQTIPSAGGSIAGFTRQAIDGQLVPAAGGVIAGSTGPAAVDGQTVAGSAGAVAGGTAAEVAVGVGTGATSAGAIAGSTLNEPAPDVDAGSTPGGAIAGRLQVQPVIAAGAENVVLTPSAGGGIAGRSHREPIAGEVVHDTMVMPYLIAALGCLQTELMKVVNPPANWQIRPGITFTPMADSKRDECCEGIAWVRPGPMFESDDFPAPRAETSRSPAAYYAVQVELGVVRCMPLIGNGPRDPIVTEQQWLAATAEAMDDAAALRRAICCLREVYGDDSVIAGQITPLENEGNCGGQTVVLTVRVPACDCT